MVDKTCIRVICKDGSYFEIEIAPETDVGNYMIGAKSAGYIAHNNWFIPYDSVLWAGRVFYQNAAEGEPTPPPIITRMQ